MDTEAEELPFPLVPYEFIIKDLQVFQTESIGGTKEVDFKKLVTYPLSLWCFAFSLHNLHKFVKLKRVATTKSFPLQYMKKL